MAGRRVLSMISMMHAFALAQNTLLVRVQSVSKAGRKMGSRGLNEASRAAASAVNNSRDTPDNLERSEFKQLMSGRDMERRD